MASSSPSLVCWTGRVHSRLALAQGNLMGFLPYIIAGIVFIGALVGGYVKIHHDGYAQGTAETQSKWDAANRAQREKEAAASAKAAADLQAERSKKKVVIEQRTVYVDKIVERPVYRNQCFDADGMRCLNAAIAGKDSAGCKPDSAVPAAKSTS